MGLDQVGETDSWVGLGVDPAAGVDGQPSGQRGVGPALDPRRDVLVVEGPRVKQRGEPLLRDGDRGGQRAPAHGHGVPRPGVPDDHAEERRGSRLPPHHELGRVDTEAGPTTIPGTSGQFLQEQKKKKVIDNKPRNDYAVYRKYCKF